MDMEPRKIESMDDLRAAMNDPEIQAANKEFSKKYLKANRPKSLAVVALSLIAVFLLISLSSHKASSVTPVALRTADTAYVSSVSLSSERSDHELSAQQREDLIALLGQLRARRSEKNPDEFMLTEHLFFTFSGGEADDWFAIDRDGYLYVVNNCYALSGMEAEAIWSQLEAVCGAALN